MCQGEPTVHGDLRSEGHDDRGQPYIFPSENFTVHQISQVSAHSDKHQHAQRFKNAARY